MSAIWGSLVTDTKKTTEKHYDRILTELISCLTNNEWRVRESSCGALTDLIRHHSLLPAIASLPDIWTTLFRVADDFKESARKAGIATLTTVSKNCIKMCETGTIEGQKVLEKSLPILLTDGITSQVKEVRNISLGTVVEVCRSAGTLIKPHLGLLVPALLEAVAGLEMPELSYVATRQTSDESREEVDSVRVSLAKDSKMSGALNYVLDYVDDEVIDSVMSGVIEVMKKSVGLTSRTTAANVIERLAITCPQPMEKHAGKVLSVLVNSLTERNATLRRVFANAIGSLIKVAKQSSIEKLLKKLQNWYLEKEEEDVRVSTALTMRSMHRQNADVMKNYANLALPLAFLAMHAHSNTDNTDSDALDPAEIWEEVWSDNTPGTEAGVKLYINEIMNLCEISAQSNNWNMKAQTAKTLATVASKVGPYLTEEQTQNIIKIVVNLLQGRTWEGKEHVTLALSTVAASTKQTVVKLNGEDGNPLIDNVISVLVREASKEKKVYRIHALKALTLTLEEFEVDKFEIVFDICNPFISQVR